MTFEDRVNGSTIARTNLQHRTQLFVEKCRRRIVDGAQIDLDAAATCERHLGERDEQSTVGAIVIRHHQTRCTQVRNGCKECGQCLRIVAIGSIGSELSVDLRET